MMVHDLRVVAGHCPGHYIIHAVGKRQGQFMGLALAQHFGEITLGVYVQYQNLLAAHGKTGPQIVDSRAFAVPTLLICYT